MRFAAYARVSTDDKDQKPETQLIAIRDWAQLNRHDIVREYVDYASARDHNQRDQWRQLLDDAAKKQFKGVIVFKLDRAFRSVRDMHLTLHSWELSEVGFHSVREQFDTTTPLGRLMLNLLGSLAEFELELISERVKAGMAAAKRRGKQIGRPTAQVDIEQLNKMIEQRLSIRAMAKELKVSRGVVTKEVAKKGGAKN